MCFDAVQICQPAVEGHLAQIVVPRTKKNYAIAKVIQLVIQELRAKGNNMMNEKTSALN
jgi:hypothetical protein